MSEVFKKIENLIKENKVVLFMKGTKEMPMCGFSALVVRVLENLNADFKDINILEDNELRQAIKDFTNWPTIPQLYIKGEFVGGCDIIKEMYEEGELQGLLADR
jgi:monothiol glutaredoxin